MSRIVYEPRLLKQEELKALTCKLNTKKSIKLNGFVPLSSLSALGELIGVPYLGAVVAGFAALLFLCSFCESRPSQRTRELEDVLKNGCEDLTNREIDDLITEIKKVVNLD